MTVRELRKQLKGLPPDSLITVAVVVDYIDPEYGTITAHVFGDINDVQASEPFIVSADLTVSGEEERETPVIMEVALTNEWTDDYGGLIEDFGVASRPYESDAVHSRLAANPPMSPAVYETGNGHIRHAGKARCKATAKHDYQN